MVCCSSQFQYTRLHAKGLNRLEFGKVRKPPHKPRPPQKLAQEELFEYAVRYLAARACSAGELREKLRHKAGQLSDIDTAMARLRDIGYLNDERFAESLANWKVENDGFGRARVLNDLRARRVAPRIAEQAARQALEGRNEAEMVDAYIVRRLPALAAGGKIEDQRKLAAAWRRLRRAGFSSGASLAALKRLAARPDEMEEPAEDEEEGNN
jgi:regulatory protein